MKELEKYSLSDLFHIKEYLEEEEKRYSSYEDDGESEDEKKKKMSITIARVETKYEIEDRMKLITKNIEKEFYNG